MVPQIVNNADLGNVKGNVAQLPQITVNTPEILSKFNGDGTTWSRWEDLLQNHLKDLWKDEDFDLDTVTVLNTLSDKQNRQLYGLINNCVPTAAYHMISTTCHNKGIEALLTLRSNYLGTKDDRRLQFMRLFANINCTENGDIYELIKLIHKLDKEDKIYKILNRKKDKDGCDGSDLIVALALDGLPSRFHTFALHMQNLPTLPSVEVFCIKLAAEERKLKYLNSTEKREEAVHAVEARPQKMSGKKNNRRTSVNAIQDYRSAQKSSSNNSLYQRRGEDSSSSSNFPRPEHQGYGFGRRGGGKMRGSARASHTAERPYFKAKKTMKQWPHKTQHTKRPVTCTKCLSRSGHQRHECWSQRWCENCQNASHSTNFCTKTSRT